MIIVDTSEAEPGRHEQVHQRLAGSAVASAEKQDWEDKLSEHRIGGWRAVSAARMQGNDSRKRSVAFSQTAVCCYNCQDSSKGGAVEVRCSGLHCITGCLII